MKLSSSILLTFLLIGCFVVNKAVPVDKTSAVRHRGNDANKPSTNWEPEHQSEKNPSSRSSTGKYEDGVNASKNTPTTKPIPPPDVEKYESSIQAKYFEWPSLAQSSEKTLSEAKDDFADATRILNAANTFSSDTKDRYNEYKEKRLKKPAANRTNDIERRLNYCYLISDKNANATKSASDILNRAKTTVSKVLTSVEEYKTNVSSLVDARVEYLDLEVFREEYRIYADDQQTNSPLLSSLKAAKNATSKAWAMMSVPVNGLQSEAKNLYNNVYNKLGELKNKNSSINKVTEALENFRNSIGTTDDLSDVIDSFLQDSA